MKIITKEGLVYFQKKYNAQKVWGDEKSFRVRFTIAEKNDLDRLINDMRGKSIDYELSRGVIGLTQEHFGRFIPKEYLTERRVWFGADKMFFCDQMDHQHLSNCIGYLDILLQLGRISKEKSQDYIKKLETNIAPEIDERFNGEILPYKPAFDWDKKLYNELQEKLKAK
jgi:hypothetical protein